VMQPMPLLDLEIIADIVSAYVSNNSVPAAELPTLIRSVATSLESLSGNAASRQDEQLKPAVPIKKSVTPDYIISLEDGVKFKSLKRALSARYGMTPAEYRSKWGLPLDYPMVAPNYSAERSALAKRIGLGRKATQKSAPAKRTKAVRDPA
jgi:predicted transcriptional regulator